MKNKKFLYNRPFYGLFTVILTIGWFLIPITPEAWATSTNSRFKLLSSSTDSSGSGTTSDYKLISTIGEATSASTASSSNFQNLPGYRLDTLPTITLTIDNTAIAENGGTATVQATLSAPSNKTSTITLTASGTATSNDYTLSGSSIVIATGSTTGSVTLIANEDFIDDDAETIVVTISNIENGIIGSNASVTTTITDDDTAGFTIGNISGVTNESGTNATFTVVLTSEPTANVQIPVTSLDLTEGTVSPSALNFTAVNWNIAQTVTVRGVDDTIVDSAITYSVQLGSALSNDAIYSGMDPTDVSVTNNNDDTAGFVVSALQGSLKEDAQTPPTTFTIRLKSQPSDDVNMDLRIADSNNTTDTTEASFSETSVLSNQTLTFTKDDWQVDRTITLFSLDDDKNDGDQVVKVLFENLSSSDINYQAGSAIALEFSQLALTLSNIDNDTAGFVLESVVGKTSEDSKQSASVQISLTTQPSAPVTVAVASTDTDEVTVTPGSLTFTQDNWTALQSVTFSGVDDAIQDGPQTSTITFTGSGATEYTGVTTQTTVTNTDDDQAALVLGTINGNTREDGTSASFTVRLATQPSADVILALASSDATEGKADRAQLTFTTNNWNSDQTINVFGVDDAIRDGKQSYAIRLDPTGSSDTAYQALTIAEVPALNEDDEVVGIVISEMSNALREDGTTGEFTVRLQLQPTADVSIDLSSLDTTEGTVSPATLTFTTDNWRANQTVTVTGVRGSEGEVDGDQNFIIKLGVTSADSEYSSLVPANVNATNIDIDKAGVLVGSAGASVTEDGSLDKFSISLLSAPNGFVVIDLSSSDETEAKVYPTQYRFTPTNWNAPYQVVVQGVDDNDVDGPQQFFVTMSINQTSTTDSNYTGLLIDNVRYTNQDNDTAAFVVSGISGALKEGDLIPQSFSVKLSSQPAGGETVSVTLRSSDTSEGTITPGSLSFTKDDWSSEHKVNVFSVDDSTVDGNQNFYVQFNQAQSNDADYQITPPSVSVTNKDNDSASFVVSPLSGDTQEDGGSASFKVRLGSKPTGNVVVNVVSADEGEATVSKAKLTFTETNWDADQVLVAIGVADQIVDGDQAFAINLTVDSTTNDETYARLSIPPVNGVNIDTNVAGLVFSEASANTNEDSGRSSFLLRLRSQPLSEVQVNLTVSDTSEARLQTASVTFNADNWSAWKTITVIGVNDDVKDDDQTYHVELTVDQNIGSDTNYQALPIAQVPFVNEDNDVSSIVLAEIDQNTREDGSVANLNLRLTTMPLGEVEVSFTTSDSSEVSLSTTSLTFTPENWNAHQSVVLRGQDDAIADGDQQYLIVFNATSSTADVNYHGLTPDILIGINEDDDIAEFVDDPIASSVSEDGTQSFFRLRLRSQPSADVTLGISVTGEDAALPQLSENQLTFTLANWKSWQKVTLTGQDDSITDGSQPYQVTFAKAISSDLNYHDLLIPSLESVTEDNDEGGILVSTPDRNVNEQKRRASFKLRLKSQPTADVTITASLVPELDTSGTPITDTSLLEGKIVSGDEKIVFTSDNWNAEQAIRVEGQNDDFQDGDQPFQIQFEVVSQDPNYSGQALNPVTVINEDDDVAGFIIGTLTRNIQENGTRGEFEISLRSRPEDQNQGGKTVTINLTSSDTSEGTVEPSTIVFSSEDWNSIHRVRITGIDDAEVDGDQAFRIDFSASISDDPKYNGLFPDSVDVVTIDDDISEFIVSSVSGEISEDGGQASFTVRLKAQPAAGATVTLPINSNNTAEATVTPNQLTFHADNYDAPQTVTVTGVDDGAIQDGGQEALIVLGAATDTNNDTNGYNGVDPDDITVVNIDNDSAGFIISEVSGNVSEDGLEEYIKVRLRTQPSANVTIPISSSNTNAGNAKVAQLTFTPTNWDADQVIGVVGVDDNEVADGSQVFQILLGTVTSDDTNYHGLVAGEIEVINQDNDYSGIVVSELSNHVDESGVKGHFYVRLRNNPQADVNLSLTTSNPNEVQFALGIGTTTTMVLPYNINNWRGRQLVTVVGMDDVVADGDQLATIQIEVIDSLSATSYQSVIGEEVEVINEDNDEKGVRISPIVGNTEEDGSEATFTVRLESAPIADVTLGMSSSTPSEGTVYPASLNFTSNNWDAEQTVRVIGVDDTVHDGDQTYTIDFDTPVSSDTNYQGLTLPSVSVTNEDDENPGFLVDISQITTSENGEQVQFCIRLSSQPTQTVTVSLGSSDETEGKVFPASLTFTEQNWNACQIVTSIGQDETSTDQTGGFFTRLINRWFGSETTKAAEPVAQDGDQAYQVVFGAGLSDDLSYNNLTPDRVRLVNEDNDTAGFIFSEPSGVVNESGSQGSFSVQLQTIPSGDVTVEVSVSDNTEGTVSPSQLIFTRENYNAPRTVTVTGVDDLITDGNRPFDVYFAVTATDNQNNEYAGFETQIISMTNIDNETAGLVVGAVSGQPREDGKTGSFTVSLQAKPIAEVQVNLTSLDSSEILMQSGETVVATTTLNFDASNWDTAQTVTLVGQDDVVADGNQAVRITFSTVASTDAAYAALNPPFLETTNEDNDIPGFLLTTPASVLSEGGQSTSFSLSLNTLPGSDVTVPIAIDKEGEIALSSTSLTFTPTDYSTPQIVTLTPLDEEIADGDQWVTILLGATQSADSDYDTRLVETLTVINRDNDSPGFLVSAVTGKAAETGEENATFSVQLSTQPTDDVRLDLSNSNTSEGKLTNISLTFGPTNWNQAQTVTVNGVDDAFQDGDQSFQISGTIHTNDVNYGALTFDPVTVQSRDNDQASLNFSVSSIQVNENASTASFSIKLGISPTADVTLNLSTDATEAALSPSSLTFTTANWSTPQVVTVTGVNDDILDGLISSNLQTTIVSTDVAYAIVEPPTLTIQIQDNDLAAFLLGDVSNLSVTEANTSSDSFTVKLASQPQTDVTIRFSSADISEAVVTEHLTFTANNWDVNQTVTITAVDDVEDDGDQTVLITATVTSTDADYAPLSFSSISVTTIDDDQQENDAIDGILANSDSYESSTIDLSINWDNQVNAGSLSAEGVDMIREYVPAEGSASEISKTTTIIHKATVGDKKAGLEGVVEPQAVDSQKSTVYLEGNAAGFVSDAAAFVGTKTNDAATVQASINFDGGIEIAVTPTEGKQAILLPEMALGAYAVISETRIVVEISLPDNIPGAPRTVGTVDTTRWYYMGRDLANNEVVYLRGRENAKIKITRELNLDTTTIRVEAGSVEVRTGQSDPIEMLAGEEFSVMNNAVEFSIYPGSNLISAGVNSTLSSAEIEAKMRSVHSVWRWNYVAPGWQVYSPQVSINKKLTDDLGLSPFTTDIQVSEGMWIYVDPELSGETPIKFLMHDKDYAELKPDLSLGGWYLLGNNTGQAVSVSEFFEQNSIQSLWLVRDDQWKAYTTNQEILALVVEHRDVDPLSDQDVIQPEQAFWVNTETGITTTRESLRMPPGVNE